jgi:carbamoyl-phosphate synthase small subunit
MRAALLVLEDGTWFEGNAHGANGTSGGELCFTTGMTGYQEVFTDPSYFGQIVVTTTSHIGNYGVLQTEQESESVQIKGLVCKDFASYASRNSSSGNLEDYLKAAGILAISGLDTRQLVQRIRSKGAMNGMISSEILDPEQLLMKLKEVPDMEGLELSSKVSTRSSYELNTETKANFRVAVLDLGVKRNILQNLTRRGVQCKVFPHDAAYSDMREWSPDGYFISNGPGDPATCISAIKNIKHIMEANSPLFGICLGHQVLALANDIPTYKMHHGHRGLNHPVKNLVTGKCEITSQNHGFAVSAEHLVNHPSVEVTHLNLNDNTVEGLRVKNRKAFSVQYHPESSPGPHDSAYLFDDFIQLMQR